MIITAQSNTIKKRMEAMSKYITTCPLDCPDVCSLIVSTNNNKIISIKGNPRHPITKGFTCSKAKAQLERTYSLDRITTPLLKINDVFKKITWEEAYQIIIKKISNITDTTQIMYWYDSGHGGLLSNLSKRFFNVLGGVTLPVGSLCWGASSAAQQYDFGANRAHDWNDLINSRTIIIWGKNPAFTNVHLLPYIQAAKEKGAQVIVIDPLRTKTVEMADLHVSIKPGTDGALALGMAYVILERRLINLDFVSNHVHGFEEYAHLVKEYNTSKVEEITGVPAAVIEKLAFEYAKNKPSSIMLGYGLQRYANSGQTIRAIDALGAIAGNIGIAGGGVNHANQMTVSLFHDLAGKELAKKNRFFVRAKWGEEILNAQPKVKLLFVANGNPVTQVPNTNKVLDALNTIDFKIVLDYNFTDTALAADLILPVATTFEREDLITSSWNPYIGYQPQIIEPRGEAKADYQIFSELAGKLNLDKFYIKTPKEWLEFALQPASEYGITLDILKKKGCIKNPLISQIPWEDKKFLTPSGKYELFSLKAEKEGFDPLPSYKSSKYSYTGEYTLNFISSHPQGFMHSQFYNLRKDQSNNPFVYIHPDTAEEFSLKSNEKVIIESPFGQMNAVVQIVSSVRVDTILSYQGSWRKDGGGVNQLTSDHVTDIGLGAAYYDCKVTLRKIPLDSI